MHCWWVYALFVIRGCGYLWLVVGPLVMVRSFRWPVLTGMGIYITYGTACVPPSLAILLPMSLKELV